MNSTHDIINLPCHVELEEKMNEKRRDKKGRILNTGESQNKEGRYCYRYKDLDGERKAVYSWRLTKNDPTPTGKKKDISLREKEEKIQSNLRDGICNEKITVLELTKRYIKTKANAKEGTKHKYEWVINILSTNSFGQRKIDTVSKTDAKLFFIHLQKDYEFSYNSLSNIKGVLQPAFETAVEENFIRKNPLKFRLNDIVQNNAVCRKPLTIEQEHDFLKFVKEDNLFKKYYEAMYILFNTGVRISEFSGLTIKNINMTNKTITIDHQLLRKKEKLYISTPKSKAGIRVIPMTEDVYKCFEIIIRNRKTPNIEPMIDGYTGFLYYTRTGSPKTASNWVSIFKFAVERYNKKNKVQMPHISPHICRHTYCSKMANRGMNPKILQYLMGHSNIKMTMDVYTHVNMDAITCEMNRVTEMS